MWVFGYGSLMWDGWEKEFGGKRAGLAELRNYRRSFNKLSIRNWGTPETPGPTLGLEPAFGALCIGAAFEITEDQSANVLSMLRRREGKSFGLRELTIRLPGGEDVEAVVAVNDTGCPTYVGMQSLEDRVAMAREARGTSGACADYVRRIQEILNTLGIQDKEVEEFARLLNQS